MKKHKPLDEELSRLRKKLKKNKFSTKSVESAVISGLKDAVQHAKGKKKLKTKFGESKLPKVEKHKNSHGFFSSPDYSDNKNAKYKPLVNVPDHVCVVLHDGSVLSLTISVNGLQIVKVVEANRSSQITITPNTSNVIHVR